MRRTRMLVIGLDCATPDLVFGQYRDSMPEVSKLIADGTWGPLRSCAPPITVPAWACMTSGRDPGELGMYGFRNRVPGAYGMRLVDAEDLRVKRVWDWLGDHGRRVAVLFVPLTSPPRSVRGAMVSGCLWPGDPGPWCFPRGLEGELETRFGAYRADIDGFRSGDLDRIFRELILMTNQHFDIAEHVWKQMHPDFMMTVEIGLDRLHHAFWQHIDPTHPRHDAQSPWIDVGRRYYAHLDERIGAMLRLIDDDTVVMIVSDHGAQPMHGGFCVNEWLLREGYLALRTEPKARTTLSEDMIDWDETTAWAEGGYYARVFLNVAGREPRGALPAAELDRVRAKIVKSLGNLRDEDGRSIEVEVHVPHTQYREARGFPPDLMVYLDNLKLRAIGSVGHGRLVVSENDTGTDSCNHAWNGVFILGGGGVTGLGRVDRATIYDVTPTILSAFGIRGPEGILGKDWTNSSSGRNRGAA